MRETRGRRTMPVVLRRGRADVVAGVARGRARGCARLRVVAVAAVVVAGVGRAVGTRGRARVVAAAVGGGALVPAVVAVVGAGGGGARGASAAQGSGGLLGFVSIVFVVIVWNRMRRCVPARAPRAQAACPG